MALLRYFGCMLVLTGCMSRHPLNKSSSFEQTEAPYVLVGPPWPLGKEHGGAGKTADAAFLTLSDGRSLADIRVSGEPLTPERGGGHVFGATEQGLYRELLTFADKPNAPLQWLLSDLEHDRVIAASRGAERQFYGASVSKLFVAAAAAKRWGRNLPAEHLQRVAEMLVISDNKAWRELQAALGDGDAEKGRAKVQAFAKTLGIKRSRVWAGDLDGKHGNEINAREVASFLAKTRQNAYEGAELILRLMQAAHTAEGRGPFYLPATMVVAGKPGSWPGMTNIPGTERVYKADIRHHAMIFDYGRKSYGLVLMSDGIPERHLAVLGGGLFREHVLSVDAKSE